jgi:serine phosphatase RsbU (regulator of sigma subunit)
MNIYAKLTLLCLSLVIISGSILFYFTNQKFQKAFREEILSAAEQQADLTIRNIDRFIFSRIEDLQQAAKNPYFTDPDVENDEKTERLIELEQLNELYYSFSYFNLDRIRLADSKRLSIGKQHGDRLYWKKISPENPSVIDISKSESVGKTVMHVASMIQDERTPVGVLVGRILIDELYQVIGNAVAADPERSFNLNFVNEDGLLLYSNNQPEKVLTENYEHYSFLKDKGQGNVEFYETEDVLYWVAKDRGYRNYTGNNWSLILSISKEAAYAPIDDIRKSLIWIIIPVLIGSIFLALIAANIFIKPILHISKAASEIGKGNMDVEIKVNSSDEIGTLGKELQLMAQNLKNRMSEQESLNQQLEHQTLEIEKQKKELENANYQVTDSIKYSQRIQNSMLPPLKGLKRVVKSAMVIYKPKDIVSGDFYWFERVRKGRHDYLMIVCADCTGHGVPGAIMSIMGGNQLTNIIYYQNYLDPKKILARLDKNIKFELYREGEVESKKDGMEIGICVINMDDLNMEFSGAGIPLYHLRNGELNIIKSPKHMIGGIEGNEKEVEDQLNSEHIKLELGDRLYMATDGFQDQFGGQDDKKFMAKSFRQLLIDHQNLPLKEQESKFIEVHEQWKGDQEQTDDILIFGVEI